MLNRYYAFYERSTKLFCVLWNWAIFFEVILAKRELRSNSRPDKSCDRPCSEECSDGTDSAQPDVGRTTGRANVITRGEAWVWHRVGLPFVWRCSSQEIETLVPRAENQYRSVVIVVSGVVPLLQSLNYMLDALPSLFDKATQISRSVIIEKLCIIRSHVKVRTTVADEAWNGLCEGSS